MTPVDWTILAAYFLVVFAIAWHFSRKERGSSDYFLAGRSVGWLAIAGSLFVSNISSEHLIGLAGSGASTGLAVGHFEWLACLILLLLGWLFVPFYLKTGVSTMPEFLERRYNRFCRDYLTGVTILAYVFTKISVSLYAGSLVLEKLFGWPMWTSSLVLLAATGSYTVVGGLSAVIYTDTVQTVILILGSTLLTWLGLREAGGIGAVVASVPPDYLHMIKPMTDPDFPWTGIFLGAPILGVWYWCTDQVIVQRVLAARTESNARKATILTGFLKILPVFILVFPGLLALTLYPDAFQFDSAGRVTNGDIAYPLLASRLLPAGFKGIVIAAMLAAVMGHLSSTFNSSSTLFTLDVYRRLNPQASEKTLVWIGKLSTAALVALSLVWLPFMKTISTQLFIYLQSVQAYISPPIASVFLLGVLWKGANAAGAAASLVAGFLLGSLRFGLEVYGGFHGLSTGWARALVDVHFLHFAVGMFVFCSVLQVGVSLWLGPDGRSRIPSLSSALSHLSFKTERRPAFLSLALIGTMVLLWILFR